MSDSHRCRDGRQASPDVLDSPGPTVAAPGAALLSNLPSETASRGGLSERDDAVRPVVGPGETRTAALAEARFGGAEGNARLTGTLGVVLLVLLAAEGITILSIHSLLTVHVFLGILLIPPVLAKVGSTLWRFVRYYAGSPDYRRQGPPPTLLRVLGPAVVLLTVGLFATGVALLFAPSGWGPELVFLHRAFFIVWFVAMAVHVLGHALDAASLAPRDWMRSTRRSAGGSALRRWTVGASLAAGLVLAVATAAQAGAWVASGLIGGGR